MARVNIAYGRFKLGEMSPRELRAEVDSALLERDNARGDMLRKLLNPKG